MTSRWENGMMWVISLGRVRVTSLIFVGPWDSINFTWWGLISRTELTVMRPDGAPSRLDLFVYGSFLHVQLHYSASPETRHHFVETRIQIMFNSIRCVYNYKRKTSWAEKRLGEKWRVTVICHWMYTRSVDPIRWHLKVPRIAEKIHIISSDTRHWFKRYVALFLCSRFLWWTVCTPVVTSRCTRSDARGFIG